MLIVGGNRRRGLRGRSRRARGRGWHYSGAPRASVREEVSRRQLALACTDGQRHERLEGLGPFGPRGDEGGSHGWSGGAAQPPDAEPVEAMWGFAFRSPRMGRRARAAVSLPAASARGHVAPLPFPGQITIRRTRLHGLRCACAGCAPPWPPSRAPSRRPNAAAGFPGTRAQKPASSAAPCSPHAGDFPRMKAGDPVYSDRPPRSSLIGVDYSSPSSTPSSSRSTPMRVSLPSGTTVKVISALLAAASRRLSTVTVSPVLSASIEPAPTYL